MFNSAVSIAALIISIITLIVVTRSVSRKTDLVVLPTGGQNTLVSGDSDNARYSRIYQFYVTNQGRQPVYITQMAVRHLNDNRWRNAELLVKFDDYRRLRMEFLVSHLSGKSGRPNELAWILLDLIPSTRSGVIVAPYETQEIGLLWVAPLDADDWSVIDVQGVQIFTGRREVIEFDVSAEQPFGRQSHWIAGMIAGFIWRRRAIILTMLLLAGLVAGN